MEIHIPNFKNLAAVMALATMPAISGAVDLNNIPNPNSSSYVQYGAYMPYTRYEAEDADFLGNAQLKSSDVYSTDWKAMQRNIATQASDRQYVELPAAGAGVEWTAVRSGNAVTLRFTMPDAHSGTDGLRGSLDFYVNGQKRQVIVHGQRHDNINLSSYWMWQYFTSPNDDYSCSDNASDTYRENVFGAFAFDEVGFIVDGGIEQGDRISIVSSGANNLAYGVDFIEVEKTQPIPCPAGYAQFNGGDLQAFINNNSNIYIPEGVFEVGGKISFNGKNIIGAGIFYTNIHFTASWAGGGGIQCGGGELANIHLTSNLNSRCNQQANYKGLEAGPWNLLVHDMWVQHFECGAWFTHGRNISVISCRLRDNYADGLNFCNGTNYSTVYNCSIRNNGDDGLAIWNMNEYGEDAEHDTFCYNTIELGWRAGMLGVFGGHDHRVYNNYIRDAVCSAGIRVTSDFPGYKFDNSYNNIVQDNILVSCGTQHDIFGPAKSQYNIDGSGRLPSIYVHGSKGYVRGFQFFNNKIYNSQAEDIAILGDVSDISCTNAARPGEEAPGYPPVDDSEEADGGVSNNPYADLTGHDLHLAGLSWETNSAARSAEINQGDEVTFTYRIANIGTTDIPAHQRVRITHSLTVDGSTVHSATITDGLNAGSSNDITVKWTAAEAGKHTIIAKVTASGLGEENSADNNASEEKRINVYGSDKPVNRSYTKTSGRDLVVTDITYENISRNDGTIMPGDRLVFTAYVVNAGTERTSEGKQGLKLLMDGIDYDGGHITWHDERKTGINPDEFVVMRANGGGQQNGSTNGQNYHVMTEGTHTITAWINDDSTLEGENTSNNKTTITLPSIPYYGVQYFASNELSSPDNLNGQTTGIEDIALDNQPTDNVVYDIYGRRMAAASESLPRGIYIVNGKKFIK